MRSPLRRAWARARCFAASEDRASLALAVLDRTERSLQDAILHGPPPLGPGASPRRRLAAFGSAMLDRLEAHSDLLLDAEAAAGGGWLRSQPYAVLWLHVRALVQQARPGADLDYLADVLVGALSAQTFAHQRQVRQMDLDRLKAGYEDLIDRALGQTEADSPSRWPGWLSQ